MYDVKAINPAWFGGEGFIAGKPVIRIHLGTDGPCRKYTAHQIAQQVGSIAPMRKSQSSQWVAITGQTAQADNMLLLVLRHTINKLAYIETQGVSSMNDADGTLPIWDHVCLRTELPADPTKIPMFHSVIVEGNPDEDQIADFELQLEKIAYNGDRYLPNRLKSRVLAKRFARNWRVTESVSELRGAIQ